MLRLKEKYGILLIDWSVIFMGIDLVKTYERLIYNSTTNQKDVNQSISQTGFASQFLTPDIYVTVRQCYKNPVKREMADNWSCLCFCG